MVNRNPSPTTLRHFGLLCMAVAGAASFIRFARGQTMAAAWIFAVVAVIFGLLAILIPRALRWPFVAWMYIAFPAGWLVSHALLAIIFFGLVTPVAIVFRTIGRDRLRLRTVEPGSLWRARSESSEVGRYFRQF